MLICTAQQISKWIFFSLQMNTALAPLHPRTLSNIIIKPDPVIDLLPDLLRGTFVASRITWFHRESLSGFLGMLLSDSCTLWWPRVISALSWRAYAVCHEEQNDHLSAYHGLMCGMIDAWPHVDFPSVLWSFHQSGTAGSRIHLYFQSAQCFCSFVNQSNLFNREN